MRQQYRDWTSSTKARLYYLLRRSLSQRRRDELKKWTTLARRRLDRVFSLLYGRYTAHELRNELEARLPRHFEILMLHSAFDRMLPMYDGLPQEIVDQLIDFCGRDRTLVMPTFVLGGRARDKRAFFARNVFDVRRTASEMGLVTELFRRFPGVARSLHPTHSVCAIGPLARELTAGHHLASTRAGLGTPFAFMATRDTVIAGIGVEYFRVLAQTHTAEDLLGDAFPIAFQKDTFSVPLIDGKGQRLIYQLTTLTCSDTLDNSLLRTLMQPDELREWTFHGTPMFATSAGKVTNALLQAARRGVTVYKRTPRTQCSYIL